MKSILTRILGSCLLLLTTATWLHAADLQLAAIFSDHMVLQRDKPLPVWGWADAGETVTVEFAGQQQTAQAGDDGRWMLQLDRLQTSSQPRTLTVRSQDANRQTQVQDILVGEVWLGSGQSNMAMTVSRARDFEQEKQTANFPEIRMFKEESGAAKTPQADSKGTWTVCSPDTVGAFSATLYFFGRELQRELDVPLGLINSSVGGTPIESWIAAEAQAQVPQLRASVDAALKADAAYDTAAAKAQFEKTLELWQEQVTAAKATGKPLPKRPVDPTERRARRGGPGGLFNGKIAPLIPYALRGVIWYQGEANAHPGLGQLYQFQLPLLINDWRSRWGEELPFAWVQLPNYHTSAEDWMLVREGMLKTLRLPKTGMAITVDIGEADNIHPQNKQDVGRRLGLWALGEVYDRPVTTTSGPLPVKQEVLGGAMKISFSHADGGLVAKHGKLTGFEIAGDDGAWKPAEARIEGAAVILSNSEVSRPVAVRYAWADDPQFNLYNAQGLPASPFRSVEW